MPARQQTLRATIEWSYQLLEAGEQRLFELLSAFSGAGSGLTLLPEFYVRKGDLLLALPEADGEGAEPWFQRALDVAASSMPGCCSCEPRSGCAVRSGSVVMRSTAVDS